MKEQRIFIEIIEYEDGHRTYTVGGGTKNDGQMESFSTPADCLTELKERVTYTLLDM